MQGLTLDTAALAQALSFIPLHQVLGLDHKYCPDEPLGVEISAACEEEPDADAAQTIASSSSFSKAAQPVQAAPSNATSVRPPQPASQRPKPPLVRELDALSSGASSGTSIFPGMAASLAAGSHPEHPHRPASQQQSVPTPSGNAPSSSQSRPLAEPHVSSRPGAVSSKQPLQSQPAVSSRSAAAGPDKSTGLYIARPVSRTPSHPPIASAAPPAYKPAETPGDDDSLDALLDFGSHKSASKPASKPAAIAPAAEDDELDALLGLGASPKPASAVPQKHSTKMASAKQTSEQNDLESFLDSL